MEFHNAKAMQPIREEPPCQVETNLFREAVLGPLRARCVSQVSLRSPKTTGAHPLASRSWLARPSRSHVFQTATSAWINVIVTATWVLDIPVWPAMRVTGRARIGSGGTQHASIRALPSPAASIWISDLVLSGLGVFEAFSFTGFTRRLRSVRVICIVRRLGKHWANHIPADPCADSGANDAANDRSDGAKCRASACSSPRTRYRIQSKATIAAAREAFKAI